MTAESPSPVPHPKPQGLPWLTVPLTIELIANAISLLALPFIQNDLAGQLQAALQQMGLGDLKLTPEMLQQTIWTTFFITMAMTAFLYFTLEAVKEGKSWGWVASIVLGVISLLNLPFGPIVGLIMLYGAFRKDVQAYFGRGMPQ